MLAQELQEERHILIARVHELEEKALLSSARQSQLEQYMYSLETLLRRAGIDLPKQRPITTLPQFEFPKEDSNA